MSNNANKISCHSVIKLLRKKRKEINKRNDISKIEKIYLCKKSIKDYYEKNESKISDDDFVKIYNKIFKSNILMELAIGLTSGLFASGLEKTISIQFPYSGNNFSELVIYFLVICFIFAFFAIIFFFLILFSYKQISSLSSYYDDIDDYHRKVLKEYIKKREEKYEKRNKLEQRNKKFNRKHK